MLLKKGIKSSKENMQSDVGVQRVKFRKKIC